MLQEQHSLEPGHGRSLQRGRDWPPPGTVAETQIPLLPGQQAHGGHGQLSLQSPRGRFRAHVRQANLQSRCLWASAETHSNDGPAEMAGRTRKLTGGVDEADHGSVLPVNIWDAQQAEWPKCGSVFFSDTRVRITLH